MVLVRFAQPVIRLADWGIGDAADVDAGGSAHIRYMPHPLVALPHVARLLQDQKALFCGLNPPVAAGENGKPQLLFQGADGAAEVGLCQEKIAGRPGDGAGLRYLQDILYLLYGQVRPSLLAERKQRCALFLMVGYSKRMTVGK